MSSLLRRYVITIADQKSGIQRRATAAAVSVVVAIAAIIVLAFPVALHVASKATSDGQTMAARYRTLEIETANHRAAIEVLSGQLGLQVSTPLDLRAKDAAGSSESAPLDPAAGTPVSRHEPVDSAPLAPPIPTPTTEWDSPASGAVAARLPGPVLPAAVGGERGARTYAAARSALTEALVRSGRARTLAEAADAAALAGWSYRAGVALEIEAQKLAVAGRMNDALARVVEADARFRAAEIEARAQAAAEERSRRADAPGTAVRPSLMDARELQAPPVRAEWLKPFPPPVQPVADVKDTILDVIAQYVSGLESRSLAALKRVWPNLGGEQERAIRTEFLNARTVQASFKDPRFIINRDTATVTGSRMYSLVTQDGQRLSSVTRTTMTLRRKGDAWVIERIVHQQ